MVASVEGSEGVDWRLNVFLEGFLARAGGGGGRGV